MLARAARRKLRKDAFSTSTILPTQLILPWLCPTQLRRTSNIQSITTQASTSRRQSKSSPSPRHEARSLATTAELEPVPSSLPFEPFSSTWGSKTQPSELSRLEPWHLNPLVLDSSLTSSPAVRRNFGIGTDPLELHQNLYACLRVGRVDRAEVILGRLASVYQTTAPEMVDAYNIFFQGLFESMQQDPKENSLQKLEHWYNTQLVRKGIEPNAQTFVTLLRAAMNLVEKSEQEAAIQRYLAMAHDYNPEIVQEINASPEFSDEEWDLLIRLQPEDYQEPPSVEEVQDLHISTPVGRQNLVDHGLFLPYADSIKSVSQKGRGLDSLKEALSMLDTAESVPYPHDMQGTQDEKDQAYAFARQVRMEQDSMDAAVGRWKFEDKKMQDMGIHGVLRSKPIQAIMSDWHSALVPLFKKRIEQAKKVLSAPAKENTRDDANSYGAWIERCEPEKLAAITVARILQSCVRGKREDATSLKVAALSIAIGSDIQKHLQADAQARQAAFLKKQRKLTRQDLVSKLSKAQTSTTTNTTTRPNRSVVTVDDATIPLVVRTRLGALSLEYLLQTATLTVTAEDPKTGKEISKDIAAFHHQVGFHQGKKVGFLVPHHELMVKLRNEAVHGIHTIALPMVTQPKVWSSFEDGGYYTTPQKVVRQRSGDVSQRVYAQSAIENGDMKTVLAGLDVLGRVPWQINAEVFAVMAEAWNSGEGVGGLVGEDTGLIRPVEPPADATYQERALWGKAVREYENAKSGLHSKRCFQNFQLEQARAFVNEKRIFFPHSVDFRGRAYPIPPILNHIGSDNARGLLRFANGKELGTVGLQWLKIHLANLYGFDKASLREREQFAVDNMKEIYDSATKPLDGRRWWTKAEDPWQCLACCIELKHAFDAPDPTRYVSQLPVHQDGTCNGLQHYAALGGDHAGARQVNLEPSDRPQDIYTGVAELVKEMVAKDAAQGQPAAVFVDGHITRKVVKQTVMTNVYGVTFVGAKQQVEDQLQDIFPSFQPTEQVRSLGGVALYIAHNIFEALGKIFNGAQEIQYWLGECGDRITTSITPEQIKKIQDRYEGKAGALYDARFKSPKQITVTMKAKSNKSMETFQTGIIWTTPLKMPIVQPYRKDSIQLIKTKIQDISVARSTQSSAVDKRRQLQGFPPNFIHSLDATHMILSALKCGEIGLDFAAVHDSFWTHASDIPTLNVILRDAFVRMHSEDIIGRLAAEFSARYAGSMYRVSLVNTADVSHKINQWRIEHRRQTGRTTRSSKVRPGEAMFEEVALESQRQELLKSEDPVERKRGEEMVTPTSIWLENLDPKAMTSSRLNLIGETKNKKSKDRQNEIKDKVLSAEAEAVQSEADETVSRVESTLTMEEEGEEEGEEEDKSASVVEQKPAKRGTGKVQVWVPIAFPPVPKKGGWDVSRLRESKYFFS